LPGTQKGDKHSLPTQYGEEKEYASSCERSALKYDFVIKLLKKSSIFPPPFSPRLNPVGGFCAPRLNLAFSPRVKVTESRRGVVGGGLGSPLAGFSPNTGISFLMIFLTSALFSCWYFLLLKQKIF
jgi:hypothetical protein